LYFASCARHQAIMSATDIDLRSTFSPDAVLAGATPDEGATSSSGSSAAGGGAAAGALASGAAAPEPAAPCARAAASISETLILPRSTFAGAAAAGFGVSALAVGAGADAAAAGFAAPPPRSAAKIS